MSGVFGFFPKVCSQSTAAGTVVTVEKPEHVYRSGFSKHLVEIIKKKLPKASLFDFHQVRQFPPRVLSGLGMLPSPRRIAK